MENEEQKEKSDAGSNVGSTATTTADSGKLSGKVSKKTAALFNSIKEEWTKSLDRFKNNDIKVDELTKLITVWGRKKGTLVAQKLIDKAEEIVEIIQKANKVLKILSTFAAIGTSKDQLSAAARFTAAMEEASNDKDICDAPIPAPFLRAFAHWVATAKFAECDAKAAMQIVSKEALTGPKLSMTMEEAKSEQEEVWSDALRDFLMNCEARRMGAPEAGASLASLCSPAQELPAEIFVDCTLLESIVLAEALGQPEKSSMYQVEKALAKVNRGRSAFFRPFRILDVGNKLVQRAEEVAQKASKYKDTLQIFNGIEEKLETLPTPAELVGDSAVWGSLYGQIAGIDAELNSAMVCCQDEVCLKTVEDGLGHDVGTSEGKFGQVVSGFILALVKDWCSGAAACGHALLSAWDQKPSAAPAQPDAAIVNVDDRKVDDKPDKPMKRITGKERDPQQAQQAQQSPKQQGIKAALSAGFASSAAEGTSAAASAAQTAGSASSAAGGTSAAASAAQPAHLLEKVKAKTSTFESIVADVAKLQSIPADQAVADLLEELLQVQHAWVKIFTGLSSQPGVVTDAIVDSFRRVRPGEWPGSGVLTSAVVDALMVMQPLATRVETISRAKIEAEWESVCEKAEQNMMDKHQEYGKLYAMLKVKQDEEPFFPAAYTSHPTGSLKRSLVPVLEALAAVGNSPDFSKALGLAVQTATLAGKRNEAAVIEGESLLTKCKARAASLLTYLLDSPVPEPLQDSALFESFMDAVNDVRKQLETLQRVPAVAPALPFSSVAEQSKWERLHKSLADARCYAKAFDEFVVQEAVSVLNPMMEKIRAAVPKGWQAWLLHAPSMKDIKEKSFSGDRRLECAKLVNQACTLYDNLRTFCKGTAAGLTEANAKAYKTELVDATTYVCVTSCWSIILDKDDGSLNVRQRGASVRQMKMKIRQFPMCEMPDRMWKILDEYVTEGRPQEWATQWDAFEPSEEADACGSANAA